MDNSQSPQTPTLNPYHVSLDIFEGPLDLLLHLIKENEIDIYNIPVAFIAEQYLQYIEQMQELNLEVAGEFLLMAATLAYIKSRMLIPQAPSEEEQEEGLDPRDELVRRLLEYQKYKHAAEQLWSRDLLGREVFLREVPMANTLVPSSERELAQVSVFKLIQALSRILNQLHGNFPTHEVIREPINLHECAQTIMDAIRNSNEGAIRFYDLFSSIQSRLRVVVTFLALLDLIKNGVLRTFQVDTFSDIQIIGTAKLFSDWNYHGTDEYFGSETSISH